MSKSSYMFLGHATRTIIYPSSSGSLVKSLRPYLSSDLQREEKWRALFLPSLPLRSRETNLNGARLQMRVNKTAFNLNSAGSSVWSPCPRAESSSHVLYSSGITCMAELELSRIFPVAPRTPIGRGRSWILLQVVLAIGWSPFMTSVSLPWVWARIRLDLVQSAREKWQVDY
jgi:hypothetical protein